MEIDIYNTFIKIKIKEYTFPYIISQLIFFNFIEKEENLYIKESSDIESDLIEILNYLKNEDIDIELSSTGTNIIEGYLSKRNYTNDLFNSALSIKNGRIDKDDFSIFKRFLQELPRQLKEHQIKAAYHLYTLKSAANFSVPGSGKTSVVLSVYEKLKAEKLVNTIFVVGPPASFQPWVNEFESTLGRKPEYVIMAGGNRNIRQSEYYTSIYRSSELYLTTFHSVLQDYQDITYFFEKTGIIPFFIVDEAHYMKQLGGSWANALLHLSKHAQYKCVLTGTPMPKSFKDIFNLFDFLYSNNPPLSEKEKIQIDILEKEKKNEQVKKILDSKIGPLFYRVRKKDLELLPPSFHEPIIIKMNLFEQKAYELIKSKIHQLSIEDYTQNESLLSKLWKGRMIRLRQSSSYIKLLLKSIENYKEDILEDDSELLKIIEQYDKMEIPAKLEKLTDIVINLRKEKKKILIWSNFVGTLHLIKKHLHGLGYKSELIYGKTPIQKNEDIEISKEKTREQIRNEFVDINSGLDILIANPAAASESISLHKTCFHAIYYDLSYNCAQYLQSLDRIHRVGGSELNTANYYFLQYENSIDQDVKLNLEKKATKMYSIIEEDYAIYNLDMFDNTEDDEIVAYKRLFGK